MSCTPSPVNFRRQQAEFVPAANRERCATCALVRTLRTDTLQYTCQHVGFVSGWSVCKHWTKKGNT